MQQLSDKKTGFHFDAGHTKQKQLEEADIDKMAEKMEECALTMWDLLGDFLLADKYNNYHCEFK